MLKGTPFPLGNTLLSQQCAPGINKSTAFTFVSSRNNSCCQPLWSWSDADNVVPVASYNYLV